MPHRFPPLSPPDPASARAIPLAPVSLPWGELLVFGLVYLMLLA
ncbi:MAG: hypothetical protein ACOH2M_12925 [Cypionkella sp.]